MFDTYGLGAVQDMVYGRRVMQGLLFDVRSEWFNILFLNFNLTALTSMIKDRQGGLHQYTALHLTKERG